jgi:hypothetical protein
MMEFNKAIQEQFLHTQFIYGAFDLDLINKKKKQLSKMMPGYRTHAV